MSENTEKQTMPVQHATFESPQEVSPTEKSSLGGKMFSAFLTGSEMEVTEEQITNYAVKDLKVDLSKLPLIFQENLPSILVAFMKNWSGWLYKGEYLAGTFERQRYFDKFHKYMMHKGKMLNNSSFVSSILKSICPEDSYNYKTGMRSNRKDLETNTNKEFFPYAISIQCPANLMNTIVFSNIQDDIIMKQHVGNPWQDLSTVQLLNWPNVDVVFRTPDLCFVRKQVTHYLRYLNSLPYESKHTADRNIIEKMEPALNTYGRTTMCYTYRLLKEYVVEYMNALKTVKNITGLKLEEIHTILDEFLEDIKQINMNNSMASDTVVLFKLSQVPFVRNKKLVKNSEHDKEEIKIGYCEIITPKVELLLVYFRAIQKQTPYVSFEYTDTIKANVTDDIRRLLPNICYKCSFCIVDFNGPCAKEKMLNHLKLEHKMEQPVRCAQCKKQFDILSLTACRWRHKCTSQNSK